MRAQVVRLALQRWGSDATSPLGVRLAAWDADPDGPEVSAVWFDVELRTSPNYYGAAIVLARAHLLAHMALQLEGAGGGSTAAGPIQSLTHMRRTVSYAAPAATSEGDAELLGTSPGRAFLQLRKSRPARHPRVVWPA